MQGPRERLIELRSDRNFTQQDIADRLSISRSFYTMIENGNRTPSLKLAIKIAELFQVNLDEIFFVNECNVELQN